jgi:hypothetical protein
MSPRLTTKNRPLLDQAARVLRNVDEMRNDPFLRLGYRATLAANVRGFVGFSDRGAAVTDPTVVDSLRAALQLGLRVLTDPRFEVRFVARGPLADDGDRE